MKPKYSFVIPTAGRPEYVSNVLEDIAGADNSSGVTVEAIVFNDGGDKQVEKLIQGWKKFPITYLFSSESVGGSVGRNRCLDKARGEWVVFSDDDVGLDKDFLNRLNKTTKLYKVFSFRIDTPGRTASIGIKGLIETLLLGKTLALLGYFVGGFDRKGNRPRRVSHLPGTMMVVRRDLIGDIRFDEYIGQGTGYLDDANFSYSVKKLRKVDLWYIPDYSFVHLQAPSGGYREHDYARWFFYYQQHKTYFFKKHYGAWILPSVLIFSFLEMLLRSIACRQNLIPVFFRAIRDVK